MTFNDLLFNLYLMSHSLTNDTINLFNFLCGPSMVKFILTCLLWRLIIHTFICAYRMHSITTDQLEDCGRLYQVTLSIVNTGVWTLPFTCAWTALYFPNNIFMTCTSFTWKEWSLQHFLNSHYLTNTLMSRLRKARIV